MIKKTLLITLVAITFTTLGFFIHDPIQNTDSDLISPFISQESNPQLPLLAYSINNLKQREYYPSEVIIEKELQTETNFTSYLFSYKTMGKKMTGQLNIPDNVTASPTQKRSIIIMLRGFVPKEVYQTGTGTKHVAEVLANHGYITIAPDFFGYGQSDPATEDTWQTRFEKPVNIIELVKSIEKYGIPLNNEKQVNINNIGIWAHSNGGQVALTSLEILEQSIPTSLWAPVTAPFPYSILYFGDELDDEGKEQRKWLSLFEKKYDVFEFSLTKHLDSLTGPIQIQHGNADDAALVYWSREFKEKIELENTKRLNNSTNDQPQKESVEFNLIEYPNTDHNMQPNWNKAVNQDLKFFNKNI